MAHFMYLWEFHVVPERRDEFEAAYGPDGPWVSLFREAAGYLETRLLHAVADASRYVTIDVWESEAAHAAFKARFAARYAAIDRQCEGLTLREQALGDFTRVR